MRAMILTVGTRGSKLSLAQTGTVLSSLKRVYPDVEFKVKIIKTLGDIENRKPLFAIDSKGIFEREIDYAIEKGEVDLAVHSLKDVPMFEQRNIIIAAIPKRGSPNDVLISSRKQPLDALPKGAAVGTGSLRRMAQLKYIRPDLEVQPIRGNVDTRIRKVSRGEIDAIVVAEAGLQRLGMENEVAERFPLDEFPSAAGQGALAIVTRKDNHEVAKLLRVVDDVGTRAEVTAERSAVMALEGGCRVPIGTVGHANGNKLSLKAYVFSLSSQKRISSFAEGELDEAEELGKAVAKDLISQGAKDFEKEWREKYGAW